MPKQAPRFRPSPKEQPLYQQTLQQIQNYIVNEVLEGEDVGLSAETPLLELGILNSIEIVRLVSFVKDQFGVVLEVRSDNFTNLNTIVALVQSLPGGG